MRARRLIEVTDAEAKEDLFADLPERYWVVVDTVHDKMYVELTDQGTIYPFNTDVRKAVELNWEEASKLEDELRKHFKGRPEFEVKTVRADTHGRHRRDWH